MAKAVVAVACTAAFPLGASAQGHGTTVQTQLGIAAGQATDALGTRSGALTVAPSVIIRPGDRSSVEVGLQGTRFGETSWAATANAGAAVHLPLWNRIAFTGNGVAAWTTTSYDARYTSIAAIPALEASLGRITVFGGAQLVRGSSTIERESSTPQFPIGSRPTVQTVASARTLRGVVYGAGVRHVAPDGAGYIGYREERSRVADVAFVDRSLSATATRGRAAFAAGVGARNAPAGQEAFGSGSLTVEVLPGASLQVAGARYPGSYVTGTLPGTSLSVGLVLHAGRAPRPVSSAPAMFRLRGVADPAPGTHRLAIHAPHAARVELAGDWTDWKPVRASRAPDGSWYADVRLAPGRYRYAFRIDGGPWRVPEGVAAVDDGFGGRSALLTVK